MTCLRLVVESGGVNMFKHLEVVVFDPIYEVKEGYTIQRNELVLFLGKIPNVKGHCAVVKSNGIVVWLMGLSDFRKVRKREL